MDTNLVVEETGIETAASETAPEAVPEAPAVPTKTKKEKAAEKKAAAKARKAERTRVAREKAAAKKLAAKEKAKAKKEREREKARIAKEKAKKARKPGMCAFCTGLLVAGMETKEILERIHKEFPLSRATAKDVSILRVKAGLSHKKAA